MFILSYFLSNFLSFDLTLIPILSASNTSAENPSKDAKLNLQTWSACLICSDEQSWSLDTVDNGSSMLGRVEDGGGMGGEMERGDEDRRDENGGASEEGFGVLERMLVLASANALAEVEAPTALAGERQAPGPQGNANR